MSCRVKSLKFSLIGCFILLLSACVSIPSSQQRHDSASLLASKHSWQERLIHTSQFDLMSFQSRYNEKIRLLTVYIEGDGVAWLTKSTPSTDPTPINPTGLKLALSHPEANVVYIARPCQYTGGSKARNCNKHYWTDSRFSEAVIASTNEAITGLKEKFAANKLKLVGYSGGGAVAALIAARRDDVVKLITVAGNLDHQEWTKHHRISALSNSLNPANYSEKLSSIVQVHFAGNDDEVIPIFLTKQFITNFPSNKKAKVIVIPNQTHNCCWDKIWTDLVTQY